MADTNTPAPEVDQTPATPDEGTQQPKGGQTTPPEPNTATPPADKPKGASLLEGGEDEAATDEAAKAPQNWPDDWREKYAGEDEKKLKQLQRYASPQAALDALFAAQQKIRSGELKSAKPDGATEEELKRWRVENGIPEAPDKYEIQLADGMVIGEHDKPVVDDFLKAAHEADMHPSQVSKALDWYFSKQAEAQAQQEEFDTEKKREAEDALRAEFGGEYRRNVQAALDFLSGAPEGLKESLLGGRMADGTPVGNDPNVIRWLSNLARELNPVSTVVPGSGTNAAQAMESEMAELKKLMGDHNSEYWKGPKSASLQKRYQDLVGAQQKMQGRAA